MKPTYKAGCPLWEGMGWALKKIGKQFKKKKNVIFFFFPFVQKNCSANVLVHLVKFVL